MDKQWEQSLKSSGARAYKAEGTASTNPEMGANLVSLRIRKGKDWYEDLGLG